jgi:hypothetical protein
VEDLGFSLLEGGLQMTDTQLRARFPKWSEMENNPDMGMVVDYAAIR